MRVIAGSAGGIRLAGPVGGTRPVSDRAREGLFSSLGPAVAGARCLDLFAGTGALGIEALSRGAASCVFVERAAAAVRVIRENLERTGLADRARVTRSDAERFLERTDVEVEIVFADPPYRHPAEAIRRALTGAAARLARDGWIVLTRPKESSTDVIPVDFQVERRLSYGDSVILVCREGR